jgi:hypothetical protein
MRTCLHTVGLAAVAPLLLATSLALADAAGPPRPTLLVPAALQPCDEPGSDANAWIDKVQRGVYGGVCGTALWFDRLFGDVRYDRDSSETFGRIGLFESYDRRDRFDNRFLLRARYALPNMQNRLRVTLARGDEQRLVEERPTNGQKPLPPGFQFVDDDAWLLGLGYSKNNRLEDGFDFGIGVRLSTPIDPYVKASYRHNLIFSDNTMLRFRQTPFWRDSRGFGSTTQLTLDYLATEKVLLRWGNSGTVAEDDDTEGLEWSTTISAFQSLKQRRAISYTALLYGETKADVRIQNYGLETTFRQPTFRKWLFLELSASVTWPRETLEEERRINPGVGIGLEMYFGPVADVDLR